LKLIPGQPKEAHVRALVIDDSRAMRSILRQVLGQAGFEVAEAGNGQEGLESLRQRGKPDLALVDWNMPVMDGFGFLRAVRADPAYADLPLVMITTETELSRMADALEAGANEYLMKPFTREAILDKLALLGLAPGGPGLAPAG
jgi:two-component system chemotaxis response regulator CheY